MTVIQVEKQATQRIASAEELLLACHVSPDGDAIGSLLALGLALGRMGKRFTMLCADPVPVDCRHLPHWEAIVAPPAPNMSPPAPGALFVSLDCSAVDRLGEAYDAKRLAAVPLVNIDHHPTNTSFGEVNWVEPTAAATAQMLVHLIRSLHVSLDTEIATCLLHGILSDTQGFRTPNTTPDVLRTATELAESGAPLSYLSEQIFSRRPLETIHLWSLALQQLTLEGRILSSEITNQMRQLVGYDQEGDAGLVNYLNTANEADMTVVFSELQDGQVSVSLRSASGFDVSRVAVQLGGGGHAQAAGCTLPGPLETAKASVLSLLHQAWSAQAPGRRLAP
jgi:phosphoesterase RecJ-like protein